MRLYTGEGGFHVLFEVLITLGHSDKITKNCSVHYSVVPHIKRACKTFSEIIN